VAAPGKLLPWLLGGALAAAGWLQGLHWRHTGRPDAGPADASLAAKDERITALEREVARLSARGRDGAELPVPPELVARVEREFGLAFRQPPVVRQTSADALRDRVSAATESRFGPGGLADREFAWRWLGWLRPDDQLLAQLTSVRATGARAWFDDSSGEIWVNERDDATAIPSQAALLRALTRALLHQHFPPPASYPGDDAWRARDAFHQGLAGGSEARLLADHARANGFMPMAQNAESAQLLAALPPFLQGLTTFPAIAGKGYADGKFLQGDAALQAALRQPPALTRAIFHPDRQGEPADPPALPVTPGDPILEESGGELGVTLWLAPLDDEAATRAIARDWAGDRYRLFPDGDDAAVIWDVRFARAESADRFLAAALELVSAQAGLDRTPAAGEIVRSPEGRHLAAARISPAVVRFAHTASMETLRPLVPAGK